MKLIIFGGRDYEFTSLDRSFLDSLNSSISITEVVCGMAKGADTCGMNWAMENNIIVKEFPADWKQFGKKAGYIRNSEMGLYADGGICFPGGNGTKMMLKILLESKKPCIISPSWLLKSNRRFLEE